MKNSLFVAATRKGAGLTSVSLGLFRILEQAGVKVGYCKPIIQNKIENESTINYLKKVHKIKHAKPINIDDATGLLGEEKLNELLERIVAIFNKNAKSYDLVLVEGIQADNDVPYANRLNAEIAKALDSSVILIDNADNISLKSIDKNISLPLRHYAANAFKNFLGVIITKVTHDNIPTNTLNIELKEFKEYTPEEAFKAVNKAAKVFQKIDLLGAIPWRHRLLAPRTTDIASSLKARFISKGNANTLRVMSVQICAATVDNFKQFLTANTLIICPGDRDDVILSAALAAINGTPIAGILLTGGIKPNPAVLELCDKATKVGLPIMIVKDYTYQTISKLNNIDLSLKFDDQDRIEDVMNFVAECIDLNKILEKIKLDYTPRLSPPAFRYNILEKAKSKVKTIILPEGQDIRIIQAAIECQTKEIANCVLLGDKEDIAKKAEALALELPNKLKIINPANARTKYVSRLVKLRQHKGMTEEIAKSQLEDNIVLATLMLEEGSVDGLVAGAINTTANTVRPALQLIKTKKNSKIVSSIFFMCLPEQVIVYGDCAINTNPTAEELADIAIQSHDSAVAFGIKPKVAMISYSTGTSGSGGDVEKVSKATKLVQKRRKDIVIDGPLQYDAATVASVAAKKAPDSKVAGSATVCIFPDLNTGNTTYKAVQRSANVVSIGPMLQGLKKPVNDLSRGALVEDIVYTIVLTTIQAQKTK